MNQPAPPDAPRDTRPVLAGFAQRPGCASCPSRGFCFDIPQPTIADRTDNSQFIREMRVPLAGTVLPQHSHAYAHVSRVVSGRVSVSRSDVQSWQHHEAPADIPIPAGVKHLFVTHADNTVLQCIHDLDQTSAGLPVVLEEFRLPGDRA